MSTRNKKKTATEIDQLSEESRALYMLITDKFESALRDLEAKLKKRDEKIDMLEQQITTLKSKNLDLCERMDDLESLERRDMLVLSDDSVPPTTAGENTARVAIDILKLKLNYELKPDDLLTAFRIGKKTINQTVDKRSIVVKLRDRDMKHDLLMSARRVKPVKLYLNENLTPGRSTLLYVLRQVKKTHPEKIDACGSYDGRIYVWLRSTLPGAKNTKVFLNSETKLQSFLEKSIGVQIHEFLSKSKQ